MLRLLLFLSFYLFLVYYTLFHWTRSPITISPSFLTWRFLKWFHSMYCTVENEIVIWYEIWQVTSRRPATQKFRRSDAIIGTHSVISPLAVNSARNLRKEGDWFLYVTRLQGNKTRCFPWKFRLLDNASVRDRLEIPISPLVFSVTHRNREIQNANKESLFFS